MRSTFSRVFGVILIIAAVLGMLFSLVGIIGLWRLKDSATENILRNVDLVLTTLDTTSEGLTVADRSLQTSADNIMALTETISTTARTVDQSAPLVDTFIALVKDELPATVTSAQTSLASAQESARIIDNVLRSFDRFLPGDFYNPPVPLHEALGQVSASLNDLPGTFQQMEGSLTRTRSNLDVIQVDIRMMGTSIGTISESLESARTVVSQYQEQVRSLRVQVEGLRAGLPKWMNILAWTFTLIFLWLGITQIGLLMQGIEMLGYQDPPRVED